MPELSYAKKRVLVTGGAGFIGSHTVDAFFERGWKVKVLDDFSSSSKRNLETYLNRKDFSLIVGSIEDSSVLHEAVRDVDVVVHLAAFVSVPLSVDRPEECFRINVSAFEKLLMELRGTKTQLLYASSSAVYRNRNEGLQREGEAPWPVSPYGASKAINEIQALSAWNTWGIPSVGFRFFNVYGERQSIGSAYASVVPNFCKKLIKGKAPVIFGNGDHTRDFIYVWDVARILLDSIPLIKNNCGEIFNVASGKATSIRDILDRLKAISGVETKAEHRPERVGDFHHSHADLEKITTFLGSYQTTDIDLGLKKTFDWYSKNL